MHASPQAMRFEEPRIYQVAGYVCRYCSDDHGPAYRCDEWVTAQQSEEVAA